MHKANGASRIGASLNLTVIFCERFSCSIAERSPLLSAPAAAAVGGSLPNLFAIRWSSRPEKTIASHAGKTLHRDLMTDDDDASGVRLPIVTLMTATCHESLTISLVSLAPVLNHALSCCHRRLLRKGQRSIVVLGIDRVVTFCTQTRISGDKRWCELPNHGATTPKMAQLSSSTTMRCWHGASG